VFGPYWRQIWRQFWNSFRHETLTFADPTTSIGAT
jgi:hypothetical protein